MNSHVFAEADGKLRFVGDFQALYSEDPDPWFQSGFGPMADYYQASRETLIVSLRRHARGPGVEVGCGHGHVTALLQQRLCRKMTGIDVSEAAVAKAREMHNRPRFEVGDIASPDFVPPARFGFALWGQCLWYLLHAFDQAVTNTLRMVEPGGVFAIGQAFLAGEQRYGREIADGFAGTLRLLLADERLLLIEARYDDSRFYEHNDGLLVFRVM